MWLEVDMAVGWAHAMKGPEGPTRGFRILLYALGRHWRQDRCGGKLSDMEALDLKSEPTIYLLFGFGQISHPESHFTHL